MERTHKQDMLEGCQQQDGEWGNGVETTDNDEMEGSVVKSDKHFKVVCVNCKHVF